MIEDLKLKLMEALDPTSPRKFSDAKSILSKEYVNNVVSELFFFKIIVVFLKTVSFGTKFIFFIE